MGAENSGHCCVCFVTSGGGSHLCPVHNRALAEGWIDLVEGPQLESSKAKTDSQDLCCQASRITMQQEDRVALLWVHGSLAE